MSGQTDFETVTALPDCPLDDDAGVFDVDYFFGPDVASGVADADERA